MAEKDIPRAAVEALRDLVEGSVEHGEPIPGPLLLLKLNALLAQTLREKAIAQWNPPLRPPAHKAPTARWVCTQCGRTESVKPKSLYHDIGLGELCGPVERGEGN